MRGAEPAGTSRAAHSGQSSGRAQLGAHHGAGLMGSHLLWRRDDQVPVRQCHQDKGSRGRVWGRGRMPQEAGSGAGADPSFRTHLEGCGAWGRPSSVSRPHDAGAGGRVGAQKALLRGIPGPFLWRMPTNQFFPGFAPLHRALCLGRWGMSRLTRSAQSSHRLWGIRKVNQAAFG